MTLAKRAWRATRERERECCGDFGKERVPGESLGSLVILAERERVPGESLESIEKK